MFKVYGADLTKALKEFDTINEAMIYAKKNLRDNGHGHRIKSTVYKKWMYNVCKRNGEIVINDLR